MGDFPVGFGRYQLVERLAVGGMAEVFLATAPGEHGFQKKVVIKRLLPHLIADETYNAMFIDEAKLTARLVHPKIAQTFELGKVDSALFIAMEYIDGIDVLALLREFAAAKRRVDAPLAAWVAHEVLDALDYAHNSAAEDGRALGVVHRDISPSNVLMSIRGDIKLVDFGIARARDPERAHKSKSGTLKGKYGYMSPEQVLEQPLDARSDLFSVGVVLAELLTGRRLFAAANELDVLLMVRDAKLTRLDKYGGDLDAGLSEIVRKALKKPLDERWQTAAAFRDALAEWLFEHRHRMTPKLVSDVVVSLREVVVDRRRKSVAPPINAQVPSQAQHAAVTANGSGGDDLAIAIARAQSDEVPQMIIEGSELSMPVITYEGIAPDKVAAVSAAAEGAIDLIDQLGGGSDDGPIDLGDDDDEPAHVHQPAPPEPPSLHHRAAAMATPGGTSKLDRLFDAVEAIPPEPSVRVAAVTLPAAPGPRSTPPDGSPPLRRPVNRLSTSSSDRFPAADPAPSAHRGIQPLQRPPAGSHPPRAETQPGPAPAPAAREIVRGAALGTRDERISTDSRPPIEHHRTSGVFDVPLDLDFDDALGAGSPPAARPRAATGGGVPSAEIPIAESISAAVEAITAPSEFAFNAPDREELRAIARAQQRSEDSGLRSFDDLTSEPQRPPRGDIPPMPSPEEMARKRPPTPPALADIAEPPDDSGDFGTTSPLRVLFRLMTARATGLLVVFVGGIKKEIYVRDGQPEYVSSNVASELFGNYLVSKGVLSDGELAMALAMMPHYGGKLGDTLVGLGLLKPLEVFRHLTRQVRTKIIDVCTWNKGQFGWYAGRENPREAFPLDFNAFEILGAGAMAVADDVIETWIAKNGSLRLRVARARRVGPERFEVKNLVEMCDQLDGKKSIGDLVELQPDRNERLRVGRMLNLLEACDLARPA